MAAPKAKRRAGRGSFRIIAGRWRGRRLSFVDDGSVRPTPDRIRETLFNWLADDVSQARCIDLYAGSGALGLEALSRGAGELVFVEAQAKVQKTIAEHLALLDARAEQYQGQALNYLQHCHRKFDIAFIDPPYGQGLAVATLAALAPHLASYNRVYMECEVELDVNLPAGWQLLRKKKAGQVGYHLLSYSPESGDSSGGSPAESTGD